ncbi:MAG: polysaccharide deacetylase family protein [Candidatus Binatia bacterium]
MAATHYPPFLFGLPLADHELPVFIYHEVDRDSFAGDLAFLRDNGYRTLSTDEFFLAGSDRGGGKRVLLTFDDARRNFWDVAFPVLKEHNARATLFVPTYWIGGRKDVLDPHMDPAPAQETFMTWEQLRACRDSGLIDVQSHAHRHALVYTSTRLVGFASPRSLAQYDIYDWPMRRNLHRDVLGRPALGTPVYEATPLLSAHGRVIEHPAAVADCVEAVARAGGGKFFSKTDWFAELQSVHQKTMRGLGAPELLKEAEFDDLVVSEFKLSRQLLQQELGNNPVYFAFPWMLGSARAVDLAADLGFKAVFGVGLDFRRARKMKGALPMFGRLKSDWLRFLPGRGRAGLGGVLSAKFRGFLQNQHLAH